MKSEDMDRMERIIKSLQELVGEDKEVKTEEKESKDIDIDLAREIGNHLTTATVDLLNKHIGEDLRIEKDEGLINLCKNHKDILMTGIYDFVARTMWFLDLDQEVDLEKLKLYIIEAHSRQRNFVTVKSLSELLLGNKKGKE